MNANQMPVTQSHPATSSSTPPPISSQPKPRPSSAAKRVARLRSPVSFQTIARAIRPPSSGKPGIRLKTSTITLIVAR